MCVCVVGLYVKGSIGGPNEERKESAGEGVLPERVGGTYFINRGRGVRDGRQGSWDEIKKYFFSLL